VEIRTYFIAFLVLTSLPSGAIGQGPKLDTSRGDKLIDDYFRVQTKQIADVCLTDIRSKADWERKRPELRRQFLDMMGLWPLPAKTDLKATITGKLDEETFTVEKLHFQSVPGLYVTGNLFLPKHAKGPAPAVLYVCGHSEVVKDGVSYGNRTAYQHHAAWYAEHGFVCLIIDTLQLGEIQGLHHGTSRLNMWWWQTLGYTPAGIELWNAMRALDYLQTRPEVDGKRLGVAGRSGGGATSWWLAAADDRIQCAVPVAGIADLRAHLVEGAVPRFKKGVVSGHCDCMYMVNTYRWDFAMVAALCAPRPVLLGNSDADEIFPVQGYTDLAARVRPIYKLYGMEDRFALLETKGPHKDTPELRVGEYAWMNRWLKSDPSEVVDEESPRIDIKALKVFAKIPEDAANSYIHETFIKAARPELPRSPEVVKEWWKNKQMEWMDVLRDKVFHGWSENAPPLGVKAAGEVKLDERRLRAFDFTSEEGVPLRLWVLTAGNQAASAVHVIVLDESEWEKWLTVLGEGCRDLMQALKAPAAEARPRFEPKDSAVVLVAPRGIGPTRWSEVGTPADNHVKRKFALIGQTLDGQRVWDVRRALAVVRGLTDLKGQATVLVGSKESAGLALYAALLEPEVQALQLIDPPTTHAFGPIFLNVRRYFDMPQAVALAAPRAVEIVVSTKDEAARWTWPRELQRSLGQNSLKIRSANN
jgi:cephalosporin-C deacetylase-like acetyl esterase